MQVHYRVPKSLHTAQILSDLNPLHTIPSSLLPWFAWKNYEQTKNSARTAWNLVKIPIGHLLSASVRCSSTSVCSVKPSSYNIFYQTGAHITEGIKHWSLLLSLGQVVPLYFCVGREKTRADDGGGIFEVARSLKAETHSVRERERRDMSETGESYFLGYLTSWHLSFHTEMTLATLNKYTVCLQVSNVKYPTVARTYISRVGNRKSCLVTLSESDSCRRILLTYVGLLS